MVSFKQYKVIGENMPTHLQETILMLGIVAFVVKTTIVNKNTKQETKYIVTDVQFSDFFHHSCSSICLIHLLENSCTNPIEQYNSV